MCKKIDTHTPHAHTDVMRHKRSVGIREYLLLDASIVIRILTLSDIVWGGAAGMLAPIFALFIEDFIPGATPATAGVAMAIYLVTKSIMQIPAATIIDRIRGERDDYWVILIGSLLAAGLPLAYLWVDTIGMLYLVQFILGLTTAATFPSYMAIFTRHIDHGREGREWGVYFTLTDLAAAGTASIGGVIATELGFHTLIIIVSAIGFVGAAMLAFLKPHLCMEG